MGDFTGTPPTILAGYIPTGDDWATITAELSALSGAWTSFIPAWTSTGSAPAYGTSTVQGRYRQVGKTVDFGVYILFAGATFGTGNYFFSLPISAVGSPLTEQVFAAWGFDTSASDRRPGVARVPSTGLVVEPHFTSGVSGQMSQTSPFTWANGDWLIWGGTYTVA